LSFTPRLVEMSWHLAINQYAFGISRMTNDNLLTSRGVLKMYLVRMIYVSKPSNSPTKEEVTQILQASQANNIKND
jgi:hypothetical protein